MKTKNIGFLFIGLGFLFFSCGGQKEIASEANMAKLEEMVNKKDIRINAQWANPLSTNSMNAIAAAGLLPLGSNPSRINIVGSTSYLEVKNDSVIAHLPYYGERQFGGAYNQEDAGIRFEGIPKDLEIRYNEKKQHYNLKFDIANEFGEGFNISGILYPNLRANFNIFSTKRNTISYSGFVLETNE